MTDDRLTLVAPGGTSLWTFGPTYIQWDWLDDGRVVWTYLHVDEQGRLGLASCIMDDDA